MHSKPPYKATNNRWLTAALFWDKVVDIPLEARHEQKPIFTLMDDKQGYINARKTFVAMNDPSGYKWALHYLGDYEHWKELMRCKWFREAVLEWVSEIKIKLQSEALDVLREQMHGEQIAQAHSAAKYLASAEWDKKERGRPSAKDVEAALKTESRKLTAEDEDLRRIGLVK